MAQRCEDDIRRIESTTGVPISVMLLPGDDAATEGTFADVEMAYASPDIFAGGANAMNFLDALGAAPNLKWAHLGWAGVDNPRVGALLDRGVQLSNSPDSAAEPIAHSVIAGLLSLARLFPEFARQQREHRWERVPATGIPRDLSTQTLVVFGLGAIGSRVATIAQALGLHVIGVRRGPRNSGDTVDELVHPDDLDSVLPRADWLAIAAPLTKATSGAISAERLAMLPAGARIINIARGKIIDEEAMIGALQSGALGGAYLDVFSEEPLPQASPFWDMPNVIVSPHTSWIAQGNPERSRQNFLVNLEAWVRGAPLPNGTGER